jgi:uncharacterized membrane protein YsdA (DUF1294 family)
MRVILSVILIVNVLTFLLYGIDKWKAKRSRWRIPESVLLGMAAVGGSVGAWLGMRVWRHKTQHKKFRYGVPAILVAQIVLLVWFFFGRDNKKNVSLQLIIF